jgi:hypothetical protein
MGKVLTSVVTRHVYGLVQTDSFRGMTFQWFETRDDARRARDMGGSDATILKVEVYRNTWNPDEAQGWPEYDY